MNKKAFLLAEETLKIVIALISISFLIYFLSALYFTNKASKDLEFAEASLQHLIDEINLGSIEVEIYNPEGWILISFPIGVNIMPNSCSNLGLQSCLCICNEDPWTRRDSGLAEDCDDVGICMDSNLKIDNEDNKIKLEDLPLNLLIDKENKKINEK